MYEIICMKLYEFFYKCVVYVVNVVLSLLTSLPDTKHTPHMNLVVTTIALIRTNPWVLYMLSYLVCGDCRIRLDYFTRSCVCTLLLCVPSWVGTNPFQPGTHLHPYLPPYLLQHLIHLPWLTVIATPFLLTELSYLPLCNIAVKELPYDPLLGLLHQTVWGITGTSYRGDPLSMLEGPTPSTYGKGFNIST